MVYSEVKNYDNMVVISSTLKRKVVEVNEVQWNWKKRFQNLNILKWSQCNREMFEGIIGNFSELRIPKSNFDSYLDDSNYEKYKYVFNLKVSTVSIYRCEYFA